MFIESLGKDLVAQGASSLLSGGINHFFNSIAQDRATHASKELMREQYAMQRQNNLDAMTLARQSKEKAGYNVNADGSFSPSVNPPQAGQTALPTNSGSSIDNIARDELSYTQAELLSSQKRGQDIQNEIDERTLNNLRSQDKMYQSVTYDPTTGQYVIDMPVINSKLDFEAIQDIYRWNGERYTISANVSQDRLREAISSGQLQDCDLLQKMINMEPAKYDQLIAEIARSKAMRELVDAQTNTEKERKDLVKAQTATEKERKDLVKNQAATEKERKDLVKNQAATEQENKEYVISKRNLTDLQKRLESNNDLSAMIDNLKGQDFGTQISMVLMFLVNQVSRFVNVGVKVGGRGK